MPFDCRPGQGVYWPSQGHPGASHMRLYLMAVSVALLAASPAKANDCEDRAAQVASKLGATIEKRELGNPTNIHLQHAAVAGKFEIVCWNRLVDDKGYVEVSMEWIPVDDHEPFDAFWELATQTAAIVTGDSPEAIKVGTRLCLKRGKGDDEFGPFRYGCGVLEHSFMFDVTKEVENGPSYWAHPAPPR
jgi:hypothetical protein